MPEATCKEFLQVQTEGGVPFLTIVNCSLSVTISNKENGGSKSIASPIRAIFGTILYDRRKGGFSGQGFGKGSKQIYA